MLNKRLVISGRQLTNKDDVAQHLLQWANHRVGSGSVHYQLPCTSLTGSFSDGRIFLALLNDANPVRCEYKPSPSSAVNKQLAFQSAQRIYGIPPMMDARDAESSSDCVDDGALLAARRAADRDGELEGKRGVGVRRAAYRCATTGARDRKSVV